ncbi:hypothetical protein MLD38_038621 [Melastoma candidum]|nr:hypothetical protein MLD38_038621 [Melastoma candidum]
MLSACFSHSLASKRPWLISPPAGRVGVRYRQPPSSLVLPTRAWLLHLRCNSSRSNWRISCFRDQDRDQNSGPEWKECSLLGNGYVIPEECAKHGLNPEVSVKREWKESFREASRVFFRAIGKQWSVPWKAETVLQVMVLWVTSFWFIGTWVLPFLVQMAGFNKEALTFRGQALYSLLTDVAEGIAGIAILHRCLLRFYPLPPDWFRFSLRGKWHWDVALGCLMFPVVNRLSQINLDILPILPSTPVTMSSVEQSILARDPMAMALYAAVVTVCAPVWEEIVFRGFLLPSLTRYMPVWCAIMVSSVAFALAHFNVQRMLPLIFLGVVMGVLFTRSRNLVPSMLLHSLWNAFVFASLIR